MLVDYPILTLIVFLPALGAMLCYVTGSPRAARGVALAISLVLFQFLVFWEVGLVPMYFLIAVWGGPRRRYAAIKFFLYTFLASLPLLVAVFAFYFYSKPHTFDMTAIIASVPVPPGAVADL